MQQRLGCEMEAHDSLVVASWAQECRLRCGMHSSELFGQVYPATALASCKSSASSRASKSIRLQKSRHTKVLDDDCNIDVRSEE